MPLNREHMSGHVLYSMAILDCSHRIQYKDRAVPSIAEGILIYISLDPMFHFSKNYESFSQVHKIIARYLTMRTRRMSLDTSYIKWDVIRVRTLRSNSLRLFFHSTSFYGIMQSNYWTSSLSFNVQTLGFARYRILFYFPQRDQIGRASSI